MKLAAPSANSQTVRLIVIMPTVRKATQIIDGALIGPKEREACPDRTEPVYSVVIVS